MTGAGDPQPASDPPGAADLRIGVPERRSAAEALQEHLTARRLTPAEYEERVAACDRARNRGELLRIFADLPVPHPALPPAAAAPAADPDDEGGDMPPVAVAGCLTLALGLPVAVVLGIVYGAWWALAVPVAVTVLMAYVEGLRAGPRSTADGDDVAAEPAGR